MDDPDEKNDHDRHADRELDTLTLIPIYEEVPPPVEERH
jgi:hypothetical protein